MNRNGRLKGQKNKFGAEAKTNITAAFYMIGGRDALAAWAKENRGDFYKIYAKLMPQELHVDARITDESALTDAELAAIATGSSDSALEETSGPSESAEVH